MQSSMKRSDRYRSLRKAGMPEDSIRVIFRSPTRMSVFSWNGDIDTLLSPMDSIRYYKMFLRASLMAMEPGTGLVRAYVGGPDFNHFKYDQVKLSRRQVGSTIKPFLYTLAMQEGLSPCYMVPNVPTTFSLPDGKTWTPKNSGKTDYDGKMVTLKWGLAHSVNYISAWLMSQFKPMPMINLMRNMGIRSPMDAVPALILGTPDISLYEMVGAYGTFASEGVYTQPIFVTRIEDKNGNVLSTFNPQKEEAISETTAYLMLDLLKGVINGGTGSRLRFRYKLEGEMGGKTGTTDNHSDGWFMSVHPKLVGGVWVGGEERSIHFDRLSLGQGANMALPIYGLFLRKIYDDARLGIGPSGFPRPDKPVPGTKECDDFGRDSNRSQPETEEKEEEEVFF